MTRGIWNGKRKRKQSREFGKPLTDRHVESALETFEKRMTTQTRWTSELIAAAQRVADDNRENGESTKITLYAAATQLLTEHAGKCPQCANALFDGLGEHPFCEDGKKLEQQAREFGDDDPEEGGSLSPAGYVS